MFRKLIYISLISVLLLTGCGMAFAPAQKQYQATYFDLFDTVTTVVGQADSEAEFQVTAEKIYAKLQEYHKLFDIYNEYEGISNIKTINDRAGKSAVQVDERIIQLLTDCKEFYEVTGGKVNIAMGSVLKLWHEARDEGLADQSKAEVPPKEILKAAGEHMDFGAVVIDKAASTVYITDPKVQLDVGAVAKGWAVQRVAESAPSGLLISVGGNVCATGPKDMSGTPWVVGIMKPGSRENEYLHTIYVSGGSVVTSGDYQRTYEVEGKKYHHIIDPDTLYPSEYWRSVTIVCQDSGVADALSTALFLLPMQEGQALLEQYGAMAMWVGTDGKIFYSPGFEELIKN